VEEEAAEAAPFRFGIEEQRPDRRRARIEGLEAEDRASLVRDPVRARGQLRVARPSSLVLSAARTILASRQLDLSIPKRQGRRWNDDSQSGHYGNKQ
jgi:hypothetical protein